MNRSLKSTMLCPARLCFITTYVDCSGQMFSSDATCAVLERWSAEVQWNGGQGYSQGRWKIL